MKKYLYIFKSELMSNLQYIKNILFNFVGYIIHIFIFLSIWKWVYSDPKEIINGYTLNQMIWYVIITELIWSVISGRKLCKKISNDVKGGNIAYNINKPYSYIGYALSNSLGDSFIKGIVYSILALILGFLFLGSFPNLNIISILLILLIFTISVIINILMIIMIGLFSFIIEDSSPIYWLYSKVLLIVGVVFPIEFFPKAIQPILNYSPIYVLSYGPAKMFVKFNLFESLKILGIQAIYLFIVYFICSLIYKKGVKRLNVNGG